MTKTEHKSIHKWCRYPSSNFKIVEKVRLWIWRPTVAPSDAAENSRKMDAKLQSLMCI